MSEETTVTLGELVKFFAWLEEAEGPEAFLDFPDHNAEDMHDYIREFRQKTGGNGE